MSERDELAAVLQSAVKAPCPIAFTVGSEPTGYGELFADTILAAGYRKPRTVTSAKELDALPNASLILDAWGCCREAARVSDGNLWRSMGPASVRRSNKIALPATVLHEPEPQP